MTKLSGEKGTKVYQIEGRGVKWKARAMDIGERGQVGEVRALGGGGGEHTGM